MQGSSIPLGRNHVSPSSPTPHPRALRIILTRGGFSELGAPGKYRNGAIYIWTYLPRSTLRFLNCRDACCCTMALSSMFLHFSCTCYNVALLRKTSYFRSISVRFCTQSDIANQLPDYLRLRTSRPTNEHRAGREPWRRRLVPNLRL